MGRAPVAPPLDPPLLYDDIWADPGCQWGGGATDYVCTVGADIIRAGYPKSLSAGVQGPLKEVLGKSVGLCKTTKRKDQLYISLLVSV